MKRYLINLLKGHKWIYTIYYYVYNSILQILGLFIKSEDNEILIVCTGGRYFNDNIKAIYDELIEDKRFDDWHIVLAFREPRKYQTLLSDRTDLCKIDTPSFFWHALRAKCWLTNVSVQRGLNFKNKGTLYVNTWHGVPLKYLGLDNNKGESFTTYGGVEKFDLMCTMGRYDADIMKRAFGLSDENIKVTGYARNDVMFKDSIDDVKQRVSSYYRIDYFKKIVLYAPTFRDYNKDSNGAFYLDLKLSMDKFKSILGDGYLLLVRAHGAIESTSIDGYIDVTGYPDVEDLLMITDILITDYSGIMFDYSLLEKPVVCFSYDVEKYKEKRGLYGVYEDFIPFPICKTEDALYNTIKNMDYAEGCLLSRKFKEKCGLIKRGAAKNVLNEMYRRLSV